MESENKDKLRYWWKVIRIAIALLATWWCFRAPWESLMESWFINPLLSGFSRDWWATIIVAVLAGSAIWGMVRCRKNGFGFSAQWVGSSIAVLIIWLAYRFILGDDTIFVFYPVEGLGQLYYVDLIAVLCLFCITTRLIKPEKMQKEEETRGFIKDEPIEEWDEDALQRGKMAKDLVVRLLNTKVDNAAFTLGIVASWGEGKTSFMQLMARSLMEEHKDKVIIVKFNPWLYGKEVNLLHVFFDELRRKIAPWNRELSMDLRHYANALSKVDTHWGQVASALKDGFSSRNINEQWKDISEQIKRIQKKIVIFIDDIDRLEGSEMAEVFQLVRNASNFPHMYFVVGYDKKYVVDMLHDVYGCHKLRYTEKILQEEYVLPRITSDQMNALLTQLMGNLLEGADKHNAIDFIKGECLNKINFLSYLLNYRDVKRFYNTISVYYKKLQGNVDIQNLLVYSLLGIRYPLLRKFIEDKRELVLHSDYNKMVWYNEDAAKKELFRYNLNGEHPFCLYTYVKEEENQKELGFEEKEWILIKDLLDALWDENCSSHLFGINNPASIDRYFLQSLSESDISSQDMDWFWRLSWDKMRPVLQDWVGNKRMSLVNWIVAIPIKGEIDRIKTILRIMFYSNSIVEQRDIWRPVWVFDPVLIDNLIKALSYTTNSWQYKEEDILFLKELFLEEENIDYVLEYLRNLVNVENWFPIDLNERKELIHEIFVRYADKHMGKINSIYNGWMNTGCWVDGSEDGKTAGHVIFDKRCNEKMRSIAESDFENFIHLTIREDYYDHSRVLLTTAVQELWGSNDAYLDYVDSRKMDTPELKKYKDFLHRLKANAWNAVPFDVDDKSDNVS
ncbi:hypothetical protein HDR62_06525 [bacterium]|nr:hypothetical protein [bacterium]